MNERRRIVISTGDEPLETPHFDAEATLTARPVVPLSEQEAYQRQYGGYAASGQKPLWKRPAWLALIVLGAVAIGVAAGLAIGIYKSRQNAQAPATSAAPSTVQNANPNESAELPKPTPTPEARVSIPEKPVEPPPAEPNNEETERTARNERKDKDEDEPVAVKPPVVREKKRDKADDDQADEVLNERQAERERRQDERRDERRERRRRGRDDEQAVDIPRQVERAGREINRIREIFEGRQP